MDKTNADALLVTNFEAAQLSLKATWDAAILVEASDFLAWDALKATCTAAQNAYDPYRVKTTAQNRTDYSIQLLTASGIQKTNIARTIDLLSSGSVYESFVDGLRSQHVTYNGEEGQESSAWWDSSYDPQGQCADAE